MSLQNNNEKSTRHQAKEFVKNNGKLEDTENCFRYITFYRIGTFIMSFAICLTLLGLILYFATAFPWILIFGACTGSLAMFFFLLAIVNSLMQIADNGKKK